MSTRASIRVCDSTESLWFYRHSDGYPEGAMPTLWQFLQWLHKGHIRDNPQQAAGWLILLGAKEYEQYGVYTSGAGYAPKTDLFTPDPANTCFGWKCGAYEPSTGRPIDAEYQYDVNTETGTIQVYAVTGGYEEQPVTLNLLATYDRAHPWTPPEPEAKPVATEPVVVKPKRRLRTWKQRKAYDHARCH
jgi:hypothetical protein